MKRIFTTVFLVLSHFIGMAQEETAPTPIEIHKYSIKDKKCLYLSLPKKLSKNKVTGIGYVTLTIDTLTSKVSKVTIVKLKLQDVKTEKIVLNIAFWEKQDENNSYIKYIKNYFYTVEFVNLETVRHYSSRFLITYRFYVNKKE